MNTKKRFIATSLLGILALSGCASSPSFDVVKDSGPSRPVDVTHVPDAVPQVEPRTIAGNKSPYTVLGKTYRVLPSSNNYKERGVASWYGRKFHGRLTSNGEIYDMYGMTAAHKTLPIPSYVRVSNLKNGKSVIVRINDRGPFHGNRIIDLSYAAAQKLNFHNVGTASVEVEAIDPVVFHQQRQQKNRPKPTLAVVEPSGSVPRPAAANINTRENAQARGATYLQAGAFSSWELANKLQDQIAGLIEHPVMIIKESTYHEIKGQETKGQETTGQQSIGSIAAVKELFKVRIGPLNDNLQLLSIKELLQLNNLPVPLIVYD